MSAPLNDCLTEAEAREVASDWHGGQFSPLYSLASTGAIVDTEAALQEIAACLRTLSDSGQYSPAEQKAEAPRLVALDAWVRMNVGWVRMSAPFITFQGLYGSDSPRWWNLMSTKDPKKASRWMRDAVASPAPHAYGYRLVRGDDEILDSWTDDGVSF